jgi:hypothetical protein
VLSQTTARFKEGVLRSGVRDSLEEPQYSNQIEGNKMDWECSIYGNEKCIKILDGKPEGKRPIGRPTFRWEDNRMDLR